MRVILMCWSIYQADDMSRLMFLYISVKMTEQNMMITITPSSAPLLLRPSTSLSLLPTHATHSSSAAAPTSHHTTSHHRQHSLGPTMRIRLSYPAEIGSRLAAPHSNHPYKIMGWHRQQRVNFHESFISNLFSMVVKDYFWWLTIQFFLLYFKYIISNESLKHVSIL